MTPLQRIAMGLVIVLVPAYFPAHPSPEWAVYDALPDPIGWALVLTGLSRLRRDDSYGRLDATWWLAIVAFVISVPVWFPQLNHLLTPDHNPNLTTSVQWVLFLPQALFSLFLARWITERARDQQPPQTRLAAHFELFGGAFALLCVLPAIAYGGHVTALEKPTLIAIGLVNVVFVGYLFAISRRDFLTGDGLPAPE